MIDSAQFDRSKLYELDAEQLRALTRELLSRHEREITWRDAKIDKLTFEVAQLRRLKFDRSGVRLISVQEVTVHARPQSEHWRGVRSAPSRKCLSGNEFLLVLQSAVERLFVGSISAGGACFRRGL